ncbi:MULTISPECIES: hypothetical protein [Aerococcus]|uniref:Uncharacterized protein n=1 Tax=Aerococcus sanguinicola TaxID=119206 RepID=A0A5N1GKL0_9LACT|nr:MULTISPECIES: hypothetical protein [Aerococcus]KAA9300846.1 hypothetical protein F6I03_05950 [Aerococcus sanguinicola]MDK6369364.1 hypothetical protein [Aerococcus sp. UMB9870]MDK6679865.1 hypothetical protein [Aerococcus sp. UMB8608]MDK6687599.1 hypothetical protein [Aerococcus sp. UMB8623]MDK6729470.1 hypothetical protein [Aerococcus urinae]
MLNKIHQSLYHLPRFAKYFYLKVLSAAAVNFFVDGKQSPMSILAVGILALFNYCILFKGKE